MTAELTLRYEFSSDSDDDFGWLSFGRRRRVRGVEFLEQHTHDVGELTLLGFGKMIERIAHVWATLASESGKAQTCRD